MTVLLLTSCASFTETNGTNPCEVFEYVTPSTQDHMTPLTERQILNNDLVLRDVCHKPKPADVVQPSWLKRNFNI